MDFEKLILLFMPVAGVGFILVALHLHDKMFGFPYGKGKGK